MIEILEMKMSERNDDVDCKVTAEESTLSLSPVPQRLHNHICQFTGFNFFEPLLAIPVSVCAGPLGNYLDEGKCVGLG